ncbi:MAG: type II secretion system protein [Patescibacteria group bacterium]
MQRNSKQKGFTLIELLVVIAIIGILSAIGLSALNSAREKARDSKRKADLQSLSLALESYYSDNTAYPPANGFATLVNNYLIPGNYLNKPIDDPLTSRHYCYQYSQGTGEVGLYYRLGAKLESTTDKAPQTDGGAFNATTGGTALYEVGTATGTNLVNKVSGCAQ